MAGRGATAPKSPSQETGGGDNINVQNVEDDVDEPSEIDTPEMDERTTAVANQTRAVVWTFMRQCNEVQMQRSTSESEQQRFRQSGTQTDDLLEIENIVPPATRKIAVREFYERPLPDNETVQLVRNLRRIAEDMEQTYRPTVLVLVSRWLFSLHRDNGGQLTFDTVWTAFRRVVNAVLDSGITWGKLLLLLLFAYEIAVALYVERVPEFVRRMISDFVKLLIGRVVKWITEHGGWAAAVTALWLQSIRSQITVVAPYIAWVIGIGALALGTFLFAKRK